MQLVVSFHKISDHTEVVYSFVHMHVAVDNVDSNMLWMHQMFGTVHALNSPSVLLASMQQLTS